MVGYAYKCANRGMALGLTSSAIYLGLSCGPVIGGYLTELYGWHSVFWIPATPMILALLATYFIIEDYVPGNCTERMDWTGSLMFSVAITAFFGGLTGLPNPISLTVLIVGILLLVMFVHHQKQSDSPLIKLDALKINHVFTRSVSASFLMYGALFPTAFLLSLYMQFALGMSPSTAGQHLLIQTAIMMIVAPAAGKVSDVYEPRIVATLGCLFFASGYVVLVVLDLDSPISQVNGALVLLGAGFGLFSSPNNNAALGSIDDNKLGIASAILNLSRTSGNATSMAVIMLFFRLLFRRNPNHIRTTT